MQADRQGGKGDERAAAGNRVDAAGDRADRDEENRFAGTDGQSCSSTEIISMTA